MGFFGCCFFKATQNEELFEIGTFLYDAQDRKIRVGVLGKLGNQTFIHDLLLIYRAVCLRWTQYLYHTYQ